MRIPSVGPDRERPVATVSSHAHPDRKAGRCRRVCSPAGTAQITIDGRDGGTTHDGAAARRRGFQTTITAGTDDLRA